jgi:hypothetical protein
MLNRFLRLAVTPPPWLAAARSPLPGAFPVARLCSSIRCFYNASSHSPPAVALVPGAVTAPYAHAPQAQAY